MFSFLGALPTRVGAKLTPKLLSDGAWSLFGNVIGVVASLAAVQIVTRVISTDDYGQASLGLGFVTLLNSLLVGPLLACLNRSYFDYRERGLGTWFSSLFRRILNAASLLALLIYLVVALVASIVFSAPIYLELILPIGLMIVVQPYVSSISTYIEAHRQQRKLAMLGVLQKVMYPILLIPLLFLPWAKAETVVLAQALALVVILLIFRAPIEQNQVELSAEEGRKELSGIKKTILNFGWSLPAASAVMWLLTTSDRFLIGQFMTLDDVGVYAINYGLWTMPYLMLNNWLEVFTRPIIYARAAKDDWSGVRRVVMLRAALGFTIGIAGTGLLFILIQPIASTMLQPAYWPSWELVLVLAMAHCFYVLGYSVMPVYLAAKRANGILLASTVASGVNVATNLWAIPQFGLLGAAISTLVAYVIWAALLAIGTHLFIRRLIHRQSDQRKLNLDLNLTTIQLDSRESELA